jgi:hypothetical protein
MLSIPLQPNKNQSLVVSLAGQTCRIVVYENSTGVYVDLYVNDAAIRIGQIALNLVPMFVYEYLGFNGRLMFFDTLGTDNPTASGFGGRFQFLYLEKGIDY